MLHPNGPAGASGGSWAALIPHAPSAAETDHWPFRARVLRHTKQSVLSSCFCSLVVFNKCEVLKSQVVSTSYVVYEIYEMCVFNSKRSLSVEYEQ